MDKMNMHSPDLVGANIGRIADLFPSVVTESVGPDGVPRQRVDFDLLRQELSNHIVEGASERYHLDWPGKRAAIAAANRAATMTLRPVEPGSVDFDSTKNLVIEGDNLEVLKILQKPLLGRVKMIYIDPPYNTGQDIIYRDNYQLGRGEYLNQSGQLDDVGQRLQANLDSNGRFHSDWLSMMYPRLKLARNLLADDGLIFVSISDVEGAALKLLLDEVFGWVNHIETFIWESIFRPSNMSSRVRRNAEYVHCYARNGATEFDFVERLEDPKGDASLTQKNNAPRELRFPAGQVRTGLDDGRYAPGVRGDVEVLDELHVVGGVIVGDFRLRGRFKWQQGYLNDEISKGVLLQIKSDSMIPYYRKVYQQTKLRPTKILPRDLIGDVLAANAELGALFEGRVFDYPKPTSLIRFLINMMGVGDDDIVLDFFAGSGTTAHAVMAANAEDGAHRRFVSVQLPEPVSSSNIDSQFGSIADISAERIRRAGDSLRGSLEDPGFRLLRADTSNRVDVLTYSDDATQGSLLSQVASLKPNRSGRDILFEVLLDWGIDPASPVKDETAGGVTIHSVDDGALVACFEEMDDSTIRAIAARSPIRAVFADSVFRSDADRINCEQIFAELAPGTDVKVI